MGIRDALDMHEAFLAQDPLEEGYIGSLIIDDQDAGLLPRHRRVGSLAHGIRRILGSVHVLQYRLPVGSHFCAAVALRARLRHSRLPPTGTTPVRSEEHTSELQSLMRTSYAVFCLKKKKTK